MKTSDILNILIAISSLIAAVLWFISSTVRLDTRNGISQKAMSEAIARQSKISAFAAISATIAAFAQAIVIFFK